ncbi:MAG TPA: ATP-binding protein [Terriglobia bacterium]|nr:ATP-binding protein [Terriglobia bacterium]
MKRGYWQWVSTVAILWLLPAAVQARGGPPSPRQAAGPLLTRVEQIRNLSVKEAQRGYPIHLRAVVTYFDQREPDLFVQDSSAGIWVDLGKSTTLRFQAGQLLEIEGVSAAPDFAPQVGAPKITVVGEAPLPRPLPLSLERAASGAEDSQWVEVEGIVRSLATPTGYLVLSVAASGGKITALIPQFYGVGPAGLVDAKVRLRGACGAIFNQKNQVTGLRLSVPNLAQIEIEEKAQAAFGLPVRHVESLLRFTPKGATGHRVRVQGVVTFSVPGTALIIEDATQGIHVETSQRTPVHPGDRLDVVGFPSVGEYTPVLTDAIYRWLGPGPEPEPVSTTAEQALAGTYDADLIRIEAQLMHQVQRPGGTELILQSGNTVFNAEGFGADPRKNWPQLTQGSRLALTGVCRVRVDESRIPRVFHLLLRSSTDIVILERPSWWTLPRAAWALGILGVAILAAMGWVGVLRGRVAKQTGIILERLQREVALEERYRDLFENATDVVYTHDLEGRMTSFNRAGERITGYAREDALRLHLDQIVAPEYREQTHQTTQHKIAHGGTTTYEIEVITKDGRRVRLEVHSRLIHRDGKAFEVQGNARDITERKRVEAELRAAKDAAEAANRAKGEFLANVSHELRTPMNGIVGMTALALDTPLTPEQREYLEIVKASSDSLLAVISDILDFSEIEARKLQLDVAAFSLRENLKKALEPMINRAHEKGLDLALHVAENVPDSLIGDRRRLSQIVVNLVGNAIKFTTRGAVTLRVDTESNREDQVCLHFAVTDTGIGIPADKRRPIFEAFSQADGSPTRKYGGSGLGLAICAQLVKLMDGRIWVESEPGKGSTFHFTACFELAATGITPASEHPSLARDDGRLRRKEVTIMTRPQLKTFEYPATVCSGSHRTSGTVPEGANGKEVLDRNGALERVEGDSVLLGELASLFVSDCPKMRSSIREALERHDPEALARAAHTVKGSVANFVASKAFEASLKLEQIGRRGDLTPAGDAAASLDEALEELCQALAEVVKETL